MSDPVPRAVLDTNACLDLFVFADPRAAALHSAIRVGEVVAVTNAECRSEWLRVLDYPQLQLDDAARAAATAAFDAQVYCVPDAAPATLPMPRCKDPDDQKFLQLALAAGARWLVSRDRHVLALGRRTRRDGLFEIVTPDAWVGLPADNP
ncbi:putative toxin-antitoxin system toxin component, PIN family [Lysobacter koreensis]|uniref:Toxin-antitoxin system toxin component, PIN family n=1 Tax=Lysobacter koreensis TaxID=266122 RepID=A0ABW2YLY1_9GAMM